MGRDNENKMSIGRRKAMVRNMVGQRIGGVRQIGRTICILNLKKIAMKIPKI